MSVPALPNIPNHDDSQKKRKLIDFEELQKTLNEDEDPLEFYDALKGVTLFENKMSSKKVSVQIKRPIIDKSVIAKFRAFESPVLETSGPKYVTSSQPVSRLGSPRQRSRCMSPRCSKFCSACNPEPPEPKVVLKNQPFNVLDEPLKLTQKTPNNFYSRPINENPWYSDFQKDTSNGIPFFSSAYQKAHERKVENYQQAVRYQLTLDRKKKEIAFAEAAGSSEA